jgi:ADP-heptose:LPS heptosyltransferase
LIIRLFNWGDVINVAPVFQAVRAARPDAAIHFMTSSDWAGVFAGDPRLDRIIAVPRSDYRRRLRESLRGYDLVLDLHGSYSDRGAWRYVVPNLELHMSCNFLKIADCAGIPAGGSPIAMSPRFAATANARKPFVVIHPFTSRASRDWPLARFVALATALKRNAPEREILFLGTEKERDRVGTRLDDLPIRNGLGRFSLAEVMTLHRDAELVISGDTGPAHAASALGTPFLALFGPSWPSVAAPLGGPGVVLQKEKPETHYAYLEPDSHRFMESISVDEAVAAAERLMSEGRTGKKKRCIDLRHDAIDGERALYRFLREKPGAFLHRYYGAGAEFQPLFANLAKHARRLDEASFCDEIRRGALLEGPVPMVSHEVDGGTRRLVFRLGVRIAARWSRARRRVRRWLTR